MEKLKCNKIGVNEVGSICLNKQVYITDPCYDVTVWCQKYIDNVSPGNYKCFVIVAECGSWGNRVTELHVVKQEIFEKYKKINKIPYLSKPSCLFIGVDSGQCGVFDADYYLEHQPDNDYNNPNSWYSKVGDLTNNAGVIDNSGVVTASGYGDGMYELYTYQIEKDVVAMKVVFIDE